MLALTAAVLVFCGRPLASRLRPVQENVRAAIAMKVAIEVDLGAEGEPRGTSRLLFEPRLDRSSFVVLDLRVPLGMLIEETDEGDIAVTGALPGTEYSAFGQVATGDLVRAVTAYEQVVGDAPM